MTVKNIVMILVVDKREENNKELVNFWVQKS